MSESSSVLDYEIAKPLEPGLRAKATITKIKEMKAVEIFKTKAKDPDQLLYAVYGKVNGWEGRIGSINKPPSRTISQKSKMARFKQRYKEFPREGMTVEVESREGYWNLII